MKMPLVLKLFNRSAKIFAQKTQLFNYYSKTKSFYFRIIIKQLKKFSHKISQIGETTNH